MLSLSEIESSVSKLSRDEFEKFREWFWEFENKKWDKQLSKDIKNDELNTIANEALAEYKKGNFKEL